jgi:hypothetical protein
MPRRWLPASAQGFNPIRANSMRAPDGRIVFVPEGPCDRSLARSAWDIPTQREPSHRVRYDSCRCAHFGSVIEVIGVTNFRPFKTEDIGVSILASPRQPKVALCRQKKWSVTLMRDVPSLAIGRKKGSAYTLLVAGGPCGSYQRSTRRARSVFQRLGAPTDSPNGTGSVSS